MLPLFCRKPEAYIRSLTDCAELIVLLTRKRMILLYVRNVYLSVDP